MAKTPRPSIAEQLAQISASATPDHVTTQTRGNVKPENASQGAATPKDGTSENVQHGHVVSDSTAPYTVTRVQRSRGQVTPEGFRVRQRVEKPHVSLYAHPRVLKKVREIAAAEGCKAHDIYVEGLRLVLAKYGLDYDRLDRGEV